jgi:hypothetical protein
MPDTICIDGLEVFAYEAQGKTQISARATGITLVD